MTDIKTVLYTPEWHERLLTFMIAEYPNRSRSYLDWWLTNLDHGKQENWNKTVILMNENKIIGCTTANETRMSLHEGKEKNVFFVANVIISSHFRGKGLSKMLYGHINQFTNWFSTGITDIAWNIQSKLMDVFIKLDPVRVYISLNRFVVTAALKKIGLLRYKPGENYPDTFELNKNELFVKVDDVEKTDIPENGYWMEDTVEFVRDRSFLKNRFFNMYRKDEYHMYNYLIDGITKGYLVVRKTRLSGIDMLSLVDFRCSRSIYERRMMLAVVKLAKMNKIGIVITLTSRNYSWISCNPLTIKMKKKLHTATGDPKMMRNENILITSADSDLEFVYY